MRFVGTLIYALVLVAGCGGGGDRPIGLEFDREFNAQLDRILASGGGAPVAELTDFDWDTMHVFSEAASAETIADKAGGPVINDPFFYTAGHLLVFSADGKPVKALAFTPDNISGTGDGWTDAVRIEATSPGGFFRLLES